MNDMQKQLLLQKIEKIEQELQTIKEMLRTGDPSSPVVEEKSTLREYRPNELLTALFMLAQQEYEEEELPKALAVILHSSISDHNIALDNFIRYSFKTFQGRWKDYLQHPEDPNSFQIARQQENNRGELSELRLYLHVGHRSDTPITLKQDPNHGLQWKIFALSL